MEIVSIIIGVLGIAGTIYFGIRSSRIQKAFTRYVDLDKEISRLKESESEKLVSLRS